LSKRFSRKVKNTENKIYKFFTEFKTKKGPFCCRFGTFQGWILQIIGKPGEHPPLKRDKITSEIWMEKHKICQ
jgi:hypothetical protein